MVRAVHLRRQATLIVAFAVAILIIIGVVASTFLARPVAVVQIRPGGDGAVSLTYLTGSASSVDIIERSANGNRLTISGVVSGQPQTLRRGPWQNASAKPVEYDVVAKGAFGAKGTDSVAVGALTTATAQPASGVTPPEDAITAVRTYYAYWNAKRFGDMWGLLTPAFKSKTTYDAWVNEHNYDKSVTLKSATDGGNGKIAAVVVAVDQDASGALQSHTYNLTWTVVQENGRWLLDSVQ